MADDRTPVLRRPLGLLGLLGLLLAAPLLLTACGGGDGDEPEQVSADTVETPEVGLCRVLGPADVAEPSNSTSPVDCAERHTAETFAVGQLPDRFTDAAYDSPDLGAFAYKTCGKAFGRFVGGDESRVMRSTVSWAWFRPSEEAWERGARWYRCDAIGGGVTGEAYVDLPETAEGLLSGVPQDRWTVCADGPTVAEGEKVACTEPHTWRAVSTVPVGEDDDPWPGDRVVEVTSRDACSSQVGALLGYPLDYEFGWTAFGEGQWEAGNRRSICWARSDS